MTGMEQIGAVTKQQHVLMDRGDTMKNARRSIPAGVVHCVIETTDSLAFPSGKTQSQETETQEQHGHRLRNRSQLGQVDIIGAVLGVSDGE